MELQPSLWLDCAIDSSCTGNYLRVPRCKGVLGRFSYNSVQVISKKAQDLGLNGLLEGALNAFIAAVALFLVLPAPKSSKGISTLCILPSEKFLTGCNKEEGALFCVSTEKEGRFSTRKSIERTVFPVRPD